MSRNLFRSYAGLVAIEPRPVGGDIRRKRQHNLRPASVLAEEPIRVALVAFGVEVPRERTDLVIDEPG